jgi:hypothetical protein
MSDIDRNERGHFSRGNQAARGPRNRLLDSASPDDVQAVGAKLIGLAKEGDVPAARLWLELCTGKAIQAVEISGPDGAEIDLTTVVMVIRTALSDHPEAQWKVAAAFRQLALSRAEEGDRDGRAEPCPGA